MSNRVILSYLCGLFNGCVMGNIAILSHMLFYIQTMTYSRRHGGVVTARHMPTHEALTPLAEETTDYIRSLALSTRDIAMGVLQTEPQAKYRREGHWHNYTLPLGYLKSVGSPLTLSRVKVADLCPSRSSLFRPAANISVVSANAMASDPNRDSLVGGDAFIDTEGEAFLPQLNTHRKMSPGYLSPEAMKRDFAQTYVGRLASGLILATAFDAVAAERNVATRLVMPQGAESLISDWAGVDESATREVLQTAVAHGLLSQATVPGAV
jgi:hypothetical protein